MSEQELVLTPRDPLIARDGRPFAAGSRMKSLDWLYPSVFAGSLRSLVGKSLPQGFTDEIRDSLRQIAVRGPFPVVGGKLLLTAPKDISVPNDWHRHYTARPAAPDDGEGTDLPHGLSATLLNLGPDDEDFKPATVPGFWSVERMAEWLGNRPGNSFTISKTADGFYHVPRKDERMHVQLESVRGVAKDGMLYSSCGLDLACLPDAGGSVHPAALEQVPTLAARIHVADAAAQMDLSEPVLAPLGGERRLVCWQAATSDGKSDPDPWSAPPAVVDALNEENKRQPKRVRMVLATPAIFERGWYPDWLSADKEDKPLGGTIPGTDVQVKLIGACVDRWQPVSGWSLEPLKRTRMPGPKPIRRMVPAGSVYFFQANAGDVTKLIPLWLRSVCDQADGGQAARDGFGLALWGVWE